MNISKNHIQGDNILQYLTVFNSILQYLSISKNILQYLATYNNFLLQQFPTIFIKINIKQYLTISIKYNSI